MPNFNSIGSGVSEPQVAENRYLPLTGGIALTTVYALTCYTVISKQTELWTSAVNYDKKRQWAHHDSFQVVSNKQFSPVTNVTCTGVLTESHVFRQRQWRRRGKWLIDLFIVSMQPHWRTCSMYYVAPYHICWRTCSTYYHTTSHTLEDVQHVLSHCTRWRTCTAVTLAPQMHNELQNADYNIFGAKWRAQLWSTQNC